MDNEAEVIRRQMEGTRAALQDKLETLEQQVKETVDSATEAVTTVKESVRETVDTVKETFDLRRQVERHPWTMLCGAAAVGFLGGRLLEGIGAVSPSAPGNPAPPNSDRFAAPVFLGETAPRRARAHSWWDALTEEYSDELNKVKGLALATLGAQGANQGGRGRHDFQTWRPTSEGAVAHSNDDRCQARQRGQWSASGGKERSARGHAPGLGRWDGPFRSLAIRTPLESVFFRLRFAVQVRARNLGGESCWCSMQYRP